MSVAYVLETKTYRSKLTLHSQLPAASEVNQLPDNRTDFARIPKRC